MVECTATSRGVSTRSSLRTLSGCERATHARVRPHLCDHARQREHHARRENLHVGDVPAVELAHAVDVLLGVVTDVLAHDVTERVAAADDELDRAGLDLQSTPRIRARERTRTNHRSPRSAQRRATHARASAAVSRARVLARTFSSRVGGSFAPSLCPGLTRARLGDHSAAPMEANKPPPLRIAHAVPALPSTTPTAMPVTARAWGQRSHQRVSAVLCTHASRAGARVRPRRSPLPRAPPSSPPRAHARTCERGRAHAAALRVLAVSGGPCGALLSRVAEQASIAKWARARLGHVRANAGPPPGMRRVAAR